MRCMFCSSASPDCRGVTAVTPVVCRGVTGVTPAICPGVAGVTPVPTCPVDVPG